MADIDRTRFTKPHIQSLDQVLTAGQIVETLPDDLRLNGRRRWIQRIILTEHTLADMAVPPAAPDPTFMGQLLVRWYVRGRYALSGTRRQVHFLDSQAWERHTPLFNAAVGQKPIEIAWRLDKPIIVKTEQSMYVDLLNPTMTAAGVWPPGIAGTTASFLVALHGHGVNSKWTRTLHVLAAVGQTPGGGVGQAFTQNPPGADGTNHFGEDIEVDRVTIYTDDLLLNTTDTRALNHIRMGLRIETSGVSFVGQAQADLVPVIMYGSHRNLTGRVAILEPQGEPLVVNSDEGIGLEFQNANAAGVTMRAQVAVVSLVE